MERRERSRTGDTGRIVRALPRVTRSREATPKTESTEAPNPGTSPLPVFLLDWSRSLSWKFSIFMISSYLYYRMNRSIITDAEYDRLAVQLLRGYSRFKHQHKHLVTEDMLQAGTGYAISEYPRMVVLAAHHALESFQER